MSEPEYSLWVTIDGPGVDLESFGFGRLVEYLQAFDKWLGAGRQSSMIELRAGCVAVAIAPDSEDAARAMRDASHVEERKGEVIKLLARDGFLVGLSDSPTEPFRIERLAPPERAGVVYLDEVDEHTELLATIVEIGGGNRNASYVHVIDDVGGKVLCSASHAVAAELAGNYRKLVRLSGTGSFAVVSTPTSIEVRLHRLTIESFVPADEGSDAVAAFRSISEVFDAVDTEAYWRRYAEVTGREARGS